MESRTYGYARVSSTDQNLSRQIEALPALGVDERNIIKDKASGKDLNRDGYQSLRNHMLRSGDTLIVKSLDRLGRNKGDIKAELEYYRQQGIRVKIIDLPTTMADFSSEDSTQKLILEMVNNILIEVLGTMAEQERANIKQRQAEGIAVAKAKGEHLGRPQATKPDNWDMVYADWKAGNITARKAMELTGTKRTTFYKLAAMEQGTA